MLINGASGNIPVPYIQGTAGREGMRNIGNKYLQIVSWLVYSTGGLTYWYLKQLKQVNLQNLGNILILYKNGLTTGTNVHDGSKLQHFF